MSVVNMTRKGLNTQIAEMLDQLAARGDIRAWTTGHAADGRLIYIIDNVPCTPGEAYALCVEAVAR